MSSTIESPTTTRPNGSRAASSWAETSIATAVEPVTARGGSVAVRDRGGELADVLDEGGRLGVGGARRGDDLDDRRVDGFVRDGGSDGGDARHPGELLGDRVEVLEHLGRLGDVDRDDERAVAAGAEGVVDEVVG